MEMIRNQRGSIILNTIIFSGVAVFVMMMLLELVKVHQNNQMAQIQRLNFDILKNNVANYLQRSDVCREGLLINGTKARYNGAAISLSEISTGSQSYLRLNQPLGSGLTVKSIEIHPDPAVPMTPGPAGNFYGALMIIRAQKSAVSYGASELANDKVGEGIKMSISTDAAGNIQGCSSAAAGDFSFMAEQCDPQNLQGGSIINISGTEYQVFYMIKLKNGAIDDGGNNGNGDDMIMYCVTQPGAPTGVLTACLTNEACPWR